MPATNTVTAHGSNMIDSRKFGGDGPSNSAITVTGSVFERFVSPRNPGPNPTAAHAWERAGLGVAPYRCIAEGTAIYRSVPGAPAQPGTSCDYCGQGIMQVFSIRAECGSVFKVGCDCVRRACDKRERVALEVAKAERKRAAAKRASKADAVKDELAALLANDAARTELAALPHPRGWKAESLLTWCEWMNTNAGAAGRMKALKTIKAELRGGQPGTCELRIGRS